MPLKQEELDTQGLMQFPAVIGGEMLVYNLPGIKSGEIRLPGAMLAQAEDDGDRGLHCRPFRLMRPTRRHHGC